MPTQETSTHDAQFAAAERLRKIAAEIDEIAGLPEVGPWGEWAHKLRGASAVIDTVSYSMERNAASLAARAEQPVGDQHAADPDEDAPAP